MDAALLDPTAVVPHHIEPGLHDQLSELDQSYRLDPLSMTPIQRALSLLEAHQREDLMGVWAERAFAANPDHPISLFAMAGHYDRQGQPGSAIPLWLSYGRKQPDFDPLGLLLGTTLLHNGDLEEALCLTAQALKAFASGASIPSWLENPALYRLHFHILLGEILLRMGESSGFSHYVAQLSLRMPHFHWPELPLWNRDDKQAGHLLITPVGGYGDQLLYAALIPHIAEYFEQVTLGVHPDLYLLFQDALPQCRIIAMSPAQALHAIPSAELSAALTDPSPTVQANMLHLPSIFSELLPSQPIIFPPYLHTFNATDPNLKQAITELKRHHVGKLCVGLAWDRAQRYFPELVGGNEACRTARTSLPLPELCMLLEDAEISEHVHFIALHEEGGPRNWPPEKLANFSNLSIQSGNFGQTAQVMRACDVVMSVDMSIANLAAMLGVSTWVLLAREGDWRWGNAAPTSPWIPQARLFRQATPGDWRSVLGQVRSALVERSGRTAIKPC